MTVVRNPRAAFQDFPRLIFWRPRLHSGHWRSSCSREPGTTDWEASKSRIRSCSTGADNWTLAKYAASATSGSATKIDILNFDEDIMFNGIISFKVDNRQQRENFNHSFGSLYLDPGNEGRCALLVFVASQIF